jgi:hypothetical protein
VLLPTLAAWSKEVRLLGNDAVHDLAVDVSMEAQVNSSSSSASWQHHHEPCRARKRRDATVRIVRNVRVRTEIESRQRVRGGTRADGR